MATVNLSQYNIHDVPDAKGMRFGIAVSEWNSEITFALRDGAVNTLLKHGVEEQDIHIIYVPGSFELTFGAKLLAERKDIDGVISLGCVIRGDTPHFDYICQGVTYGITQLNIQFKKPVIFGVLTTENKGQALARAGGVHGNKGDEAAVTAIKMVEINK